MLQMISIIIGLGSIIWSFFSPKWAWLPIAVLISIIVITFFSVKLRKWKYIDELSSDANKLLQNYGHYYSMPFAARDFSSSSSTIQFIGIAMAISNAVKGFYWGIAIAVLIWLIMGPIAMGFNPTSFIKDESFRSAHEEIIEWINSKNL